MDRHILTRNRFRHKGEVKVNIIRYILYVIFFVCYIHFHFLCLYLSIYLYLYASLSLSSGILVGEYLFPQSSFPSTLIFPSPDSSPSWILQPTWFLSFLTSSLLSPKLFCSLCSSNSRVLLWVCLSVHFCFSFWRVHSFTYLKK